MSMIRGLCLAPVAALALSAVAHAQNLAVGAVFGTPGIGVEAQAKVSRWLVLRAAADFAEFDRDETYGDIAYAGKLKLVTGGAFVDIHPLGGGLLVSGGAYIGKRRGELDGEPTTTVRIGDKPYTPAQVGRIDSDIKMGDIQPFAGLGYDTTFRRTGRVGLKGVVGMAFSHSPDVTLTASGGALSTNAVFLQSLRDEEGQIRDDAKGFKYFPVAQVGLTYRF
jgi:hypothetical protein